MTNIMLSALVFGLGYVTALYKLSLLLLLTYTIRTIHAWSRGRTYKVDQELIKNVQIM